MTIEIFYIDQKLKIDQRFSISIAMDKRGSVYVYDCHVSMLTPKKEQGYFSRPDGIKRRMVHQYDMDNIPDVEWFDSAENLEDLIIKSIGVKYDSKKVPLHLLPPEALYEAARVLAYGAYQKKPQPYGERNWEKGLNYSQVLRAAIGHLLSYSAGQDNDPETDLPHLSHGLCNIMFLIAYTIRGMDHLDDRPKTKYPNFDFLGEIKEKQKHD